MKNILLGPPKGRRNRERGNVQLEKETKREAMKMRKLKFKKLNC